LTSFDSPVSDPKEVAVSDRAAKEYVQYTQHSSSSPNMIYVMLAYGTITTRDSKLRPKWKSNGRLRDLHCLRLWNMDHEVMHVPRDYQTLPDSRNGWTLGCLRIMEKFAASLIRAKLSSSRIQQSSNALHNRRQTAGSDWFFEYYVRKMLQIDTLSVTINA
jgi:hypothetical protein